MPLSKPSSTITAATLAGMFMTVLFGALKSFMPEVVLDPMLISGATAFAGALVGYFKKENVLKAGNLG